MKNKEGTFKVRVLSAVSNVKGGDSFGELSLIFNKPRAATIMAKVRTHAASLNRTDYDKIIKPIEEKKLNAKINFLKSYPFLSHLSRQTLGKLPHNVSEITFNRGNTVYREGDKADGLFLVYKGEFKIYKRLEIKESNTYQRFGKYGKRVVK
jgi:cAMP-dependent protein kinase regulator